MGPSAILIKYEVRFFKKEKKKITTFPSESQVLATFIGYKN